MADIFVSYARTDRERVAPLVAALEAEGWSVWWDPEVDPGQEFDRQIGAELQAARAVLAVWTPASVESRWVRGEAREAADRGVLVPVRFDNARLPIDVRALHTTDLDDWQGDPASPAFRLLARALSAMMAGAGQPEAAAQPARTAGPSVCVLPFANISGDPEQEYFSDGISEDIITDLSKVSALQVVSRNTAFTFKGRHVDVRQVARQLGVSHVLEGSVRKAGQRVRITAQLIDGASDSHVWAERYDRDLSDIFALQDEISRAIVAALKLRLAPEESQAIGQRTTTDPEAYKLYLMARQYSVLGSARHQELIVRLCKRAVQIDPNYARAWALMAIGYCVLLINGAPDAQGGLEAADRAIALDPNLADAWAAKGRLLSGQARYDEAVAALDRALMLDPHSYEANIAAGTCAIVMRRYRDAIAYMEKAAQETPDDFRAIGIVIQVYDAIGDDEGARSASRRALERIEKIVAREPDHGSAMSFGVTALIHLGETDRAVEWAERALLLDPDNVNLNYNVACSLVRIGQVDRALELLGPVIGQAQPDGLRWMRQDTDLDSLRDDPRLEALLAAAEQRVGITP
jgi:adenylate cyclase